MGILTSFFGATLVFVSSKSRIKGTLLIPAVLLFSVVLFFNYQTVAEKFETVILRKDSLDNFSGRDIVWELAEGYIEKRPLLGYGFASDLNIHKFYGVDLRAMQFRGYGVSSSYVGLQIHFGKYLPVLLFSALWLWGLYCVWKGWRKDQQLVVCGAVILCGLLVCITEPWIYSMGNAYAWFYWSILMLAAKSLYEKRISKNEKSPSLHS